VRRFFETFGVDGYHVMVCLSLGILSLVGYDEGQCSPPTLDLLLPPGLSFKENSR
jgi:hypothetical protein